MNSGGTASYTGGSGGSASRSPTPWERETAPRARPWITRRPGLGAQRRHHRGYGRADHERRSDPAGHRHGRLGETGHHYHALADGSFGLLDDARRDVRAGNGNHDYGDLQRGGHGGYDGGHADVGLELGGTASYTGGSGGSALTFTYTVGEGDSTSVRPWITRRPGRWRSTAAPSWIRPRDHERRSDPAGHRHGRLGETGHHYHALADGSFGLLDDARRDVRAGNGNHDYGDLQRGGHGGYDGGHADVGLEFGRDGELYRRERRFGASRSPTPWERETAPRARPWITRRPGRWRSTAAPSWIRPRRPRTPI